MTRLIQHIIKLRWLYISLIAIFTLSGLYFTSQNLGINNALNIWFLEDNENYKAYLDYQKEQGSDKIVVVMIPTENALDTNFVSKLNQLHHKIDSIKVVHQSYSLAKITYPVYNRKKISTRKLYTKGRDTSAIRSILTKMPAIKNRLASEDHKNAFFYVQFIPNDELDESKEAILEEISNAVKNEFGDTFYFSGAPVLNEAFNNTVFNETILFAVITVAVLLVLLYFLLPSFKYIPLAFFSIVVPVSLVLGMMSISGIQLNMITMIIPTILMIYGVSDSIHIISIYEQEQSKHSDFKEVLKKTLQLSLKPCFYTTLSTIIGYFALYFSPLPAFKQMGLFASLGILISFILVYLITFIGFSFFKKSSPVKEKKPSNNRLIQFVVKGSINQTTTRKKWVLLTTLLLMIASFWSVSQIEVNTDSLNLLSDGKEKEDLHAIEDELNGSARVQIEIWKTNGEKLNIFDLDSSLQLFQEHLAEQKDISASISVSNIKSFLQKKTPKTKWRALKKHVESSDENLNNRNDFISLTNQNQTSVYVDFMIKEADTKTLNAIFKQINEQFSEDFPEEYQMKLNGFTPVFATLNNYILTSQIRSFLVAFVCSFVILLLLLKNFKLSLVAMIPNLIPLAILSIIMYLLKIDLEVATALLAPIVLGISMDDTLHLMHKYQLSKEQSSKAKIDDAMKYTGSALITTTFSLVIGFGIIAVSQVNSVKNFGILCAVAIASALFADLIILPAILKSKWFQKSNE